MKKVGAIALGTLLVLAGVTFGLQGLGMIGGSAMSGKNLWAVLGPLIALAGVVMVVKALRGVTTVTAGATSRPDEDRAPGSDTAP